MVLPAVMAAEGVAFATLAGLDGSPAWRVARVLVVIAVTALALWFTRRAGRAGWGATVLALGIAGTAAGAGVASGHLAQAGLDAAAVLAAVALVTGLALLVWGTAVLARHGYGALLVDTRGHGLSGGHAMDFGWWGNRDLAAAVSFLARQPGIGAGKIAVLGESMGGEQALAAAGSDPRIRAVIAEGVTGQQLADHGWLPRDIDGILRRGVGWVQFAAAGLISGAPRPASIRDGIRAAARPALIIAGGAAAGEPVAARWFQAAAPATVQVWVVPHAGHTQGLAIAPQAWEARVTSFLDRALKP